MLPINLIFNLVVKNMEQEQEHSSRLTITHHPISSKDPPCTCWLWCGLYHCEAVTVAVPTQQACQQGGGGSTDSFVESRMALLL